MNVTIRTFYYGLHQDSHLTSPDVEPAHGLWLIEELVRRGYDISTNTFYYIFHSLE